MTATNGEEIIRLRHDEATDRTLTAVREESRDSFTYSIYSHPKGLWLQHYLKVLIQKTVHLCHSSILKYYDKNAFIFDDPDLQKVKSFTYMFAENYLRDTHEKHLDMSFRHRKAWLVIESVEIALFILKEDIWWRSRIKKMVNIWENSERFTFTEAEAENLKRW